MQKYYRCDFIIIIIIIYQEMKSFKHTLFSWQAIFFFQHGIKELVECFNSCHVAGHVSFMLVVFLALVSEMQWYS